MNTAELVWFKSSYSSPDGDSCVEVATSRPGTVYVRDSKNEHSPQLTIPSAAWTTFVTYTTD